MLVRLADGELDALEELYDRYKTMAYSIAYRITNDATLAEDVVQDAFLGAWRNAARYVEGRGSVKTWLLSIVHHRAIDAVRRRRPTTELPEREAAAARRADRCPTSGPRSRPGSTPRRSAGALAALSDVQREAIELAYFGGLTQQEIADRTATPLGTVKSRMRLGLLAMRRRSGERGVDRRERDSDDRPPAELTCDEVRELAGAFVLGALEPAEDGGRARAPRDVRRGPRRDRRAGSACCRRWPTSVPVVEPPAALKARIMAAAAADLDARGDGRRRAAGRRARGAGRAGGSRRRRARRRSRAPTSANAPRDRGRRRRPGSLRIAAVLGDRRCSAAGTCCSRDQLDAAQAYEQSVAAVLDVAGQPGVADRDPRAADGGGPARARRGQRRRRR